MTPPPEPPSGPPASDLVVLDWRLAARTVVGATLVLVAAGVAGLALREPLITAGAWFFGRFGLWGMFFGTIVIDVSIIPLTNEPLMLLALSADQSPWMVFWVTSVASWLAGPLGWSIGRLIDRATPFGRRLCGRYPAMTDLLRRYGAVAVALGATTPLPFSASTWLAGLLGVPLRGVMLASLLRFPKTGFYLWLLMQGWALGA